MATCNSPDCETVAGSGVRQDEGRKPMLVQAYVRGAATAAVTGRQGCRPQ